MSEDGAAARLRQAEPGQDADPLGRMLLAGRVGGVGKPLVVEVMEQTDQPPRLCVLARARRHGAHRELDRVHVLSQRVGGGILVQQGEGATAVEGHRSSGGTWDAC